ncbi:hypothetical protein KIH86_17110 [Paenibacillus sp. HN-1]|uniref:hypothetical protein n=1 Tax=Paenibacillus TaxID=44249 RepID=UPI001CA7C7CD|nr:MULTISPECIES: hypothetical protein [Paenibacillus]MBY9081913.1 hypothetical protein [Paenibacillus sp. CGMCC 1.18879]MBY9085929.1 hypothetical protein [Paenibacillus sinensis]
MQPWGYIVLLGGCALVYALLLPSRNRNKESGGDKQTVKEVEAALELYMADVERENRELMDVLGSIKNQTQNNQASLQEQIGELKGQLDSLHHRIAQLENRTAATENGLLQLAISGPAPREGSEDKDQETEPKTKPVSTIKLRYPQLFELHEEGKSIDAIAKKTGMQSGEIQLILQLAKQEESV